MTLKTTFMLKAVKKLSLQ